MPSAVIYSGAGVAVPADFLGMTFRDSPWSQSVTDRWDIVSVSAALDRIYLSVSNNMRLDSIERIKFVSTTGTLPAPFVMGVEYYPQNRDPASHSTSTQLSATPTGPIIDIEDAGTGTHSIKLLGRDGGVPFGLVRSLGGFPLWARINTADGVYFWDDLDSHILYHYALGRRTIYTLDNTPTWAAVNGALDAMGIAGGGQAPSSLSLHAANFVTALLSRYNKVSPVNPNGYKMVAAIEAWNEPSFSAPGTVGQAWCATMAQLAQQTRHVYAAVKAVDSSCLMLGPGFTNAHAFVAVGASGDNAYQWLIASDGAGGYGKDWIDGFAYHTYNLGSQTLLARVPSLVASLRAMLVGVGLSPSFPIYQTERGFPTGEHPNLTLRMSAIEAALGVRATVDYSYSRSDYAHYSPDLDASARDFMAKICGQTITYCAIEQDGSITAVTGAGVLRV